LRSQTGRLFTSGGEVHRGRLCRATAAATCRRTSTGRLADQIGLLDLLAKRSARLHGRTGQFLLRFVGKDGFVISPDVVACVRDAGLDIAERPT
jgi:hypothetical protein